MSQGNKKITKKKKGKELKFFGWSSSLIQPVLFLKNWQPVKKFCSIVVPVCETVSKYIPVLQCVSSFEGTSYKMLQGIAITFLVSYCFTSVYTSADIFFTTFQSFIQII